MMFMVSFEQGWVQARKHTAIMPVHVHRSHSSRHIQRFGIRRHYQLRLILRVQLYFGGPLALPKMG
jgi:hypothetical protein